MSRSNEITVLKAEIDALKTEMEGLKEFVRAIYNMIGDEEDYESSEFAPNTNMGRFNT